MDRRSYKTLLHLNNACLGHMNSISIFYQDLDISTELHAILSDMCEENADLRLTLTQIMQLSSSHTAGHMIESFSIHIMRMYELVFGSADNVSYGLLSVNIYC